MPLPRDKKPELTFEPLSEGLGFHPFSDGLPYAPIGKALTSKVASAASSAGAGAMSAGKPRYVTKPATTQRLQAPHVPVAPHLPPLGRMAPPKPVVQPTLARRPSAKTGLEGLDIGELTPGMLEPTFGFGYVAKRVFAYVLDSVFNLGICVGALSAALWKQNLSPELLLNPGIVLIAGLFLGFFNWAITTAEEVAFGTSLGKRIFGLAVHGTASAVFLRAFFFLPSVCFGGIGLLWSLFDRRKRCWHDLVVDLQPLEISRL